MVIGHEPTRFPYDTQYLHVQTPFAQAPLSPMSICALEVGASSLLFFRNIPTTATLVGNKRKVVAGGHVLDKERVMVDRV